MQVGIQRSLSRLKAVKIEEGFMPMSYIPEAASVFAKLAVNGAFDDLGINQSLAPKLKDIDARVKGPAMIAVLSHTYGYLLKLQGVGGGNKPGAGTDHRPTDIATARPPRPIQVWTEQWVYVRRGSRAKDIIGDVSELLDEVILLAKTTNLPEAQAGLTDIERAQLIAILETTLAMLKAPMIEPGLLKKTAKMAKDVAQKAAKTKVEEALGASLEHVAKRVAELIANLL
ncbi:hypothetical protein B5K06_00720 [Rhizobium grahamii]|uniref:Uncharacterized protein n=2 Tax=Rhizobium grahamii TaxID=1120045 RepID=A0A370KY00_9HYPH|nr:hypothetical protein B5K06_00720 [Rhizobium grahamii]